jgi:hypothetical protein
MKGNFQVRFLDGWAPAMVPGHSASYWVQLGHGLFKQVVSLLAVPFDEVSLLKPSVS